MLSMFAILKISDIDVTFSKNYLFLQSFQNKHLEMSVRDTEKLKAVAE